VFDAFVMKLDPKGNIVFATYLGGNGADLATSVAVDPAGNIYVAGVTQVNYSNPSIAPIPFPTTAGAIYTQRSSAPIDSFVAKLNPSGTKLIYSTLIPAMYNPQVTVDAAGKAYFTAQPFQFISVVPATSGAYKTTPSGSFIARINPSGTSFEYATYFDGYVEGIAVDAAGDLYITGSGLFMTTTDGSTPATNGAVLIAELNSTGTGLIYATLFGGTNRYNFDGGQAIRVDGQGNVYVLGQAVTQNFPTTPGVFQPSSSPPAWIAPTNSHGFLAKFKPGGNTVVYSTFFTGAEVFDVDAAGNAYVIAKAVYGFPTTAGATRRCMAGGTSDLIIAKIAPDGTLTAATYLGGSGKDGTAPFLPNYPAQDPELQAVAVGSDGFVYVAGGTDPPISPEHKVSRSIHFPPS
jgi:hypothetical protein